MLLLLASLALATAEGTQAQTPPTIIQDPQGLIVPAGTTVSFTVVATGDPPVTYRWRRNGTTSTAPSTNGATLVITNATLAGRYEVVVANPSGSRLAHVAPLSFFSISNGVDGVGLNLSAYYVTGASDVYQFQYVTEPSATNWTTLTNLALPQGPYRFVDPTATNSPQRYYRAVLQY